MTSFRDATFLTIASCWNQTFVTQEEWLRLLMVFGTRGSRLAFVDNEGTAGGPCSDVQYAEYLFVNPKRFARADLGHRPKG